MNGKIIVFEGTDGSGKATQKNKLCEYFRKNGIDYREVTFPRYSEESSSLVRMYLGGEFGSKPTDVPAKTSSVFFAVDRYASYKTSVTNKFNCICFILLCFISEGLEGILPEWWYHCM